MKSQQSILFISENYFYLFHENGATISPNYGTISSLENIESDNTIAYIDAQHYNIIPDSLFNESKIDSYLKLTTDQLTGITPIANKLPQLNSILLWTLEEKIKKNIIINSPGSTFCHLLELFLKEPINQDTRSEIRLRLTKNSIYIISLKNGELQATNRFNITGEQDSIYYTLLCAEHLQLNKKNTIIDVKGHYNNKLIDQLEKYFITANITKSDDLTFQSFLL